MCRLLTDRTKSLWCQLYFVDIPLRVHTPIVARPGPSLLEDLKTADNNGQARWRVLPVYYSHPNVNVTHYEWGQCLYKNHCLCALDLNSEKKCKLAVFDHHYEVNWYLFEVRKTIIIGQFAKSTTNCERSQWLYIAKPAKRCGVPENKQRNNHLLAAVVQEPLPAVCSLGLLNQSSISTQKRNVNRQ